MTPQETLTPRGLAYSELAIEVFRLNGLLLAAGDELAKPAGLTSARWQVLGVIDHRPATVAEVARTMGLTRQSVRQTADALAGAGLIAFQPNPRHRRAKLLEPTARGRAALAEVERRQADWANRIGGHVSLPELTETITMLRELSGLLGAADQPVGQP
ncbi:MarR family transcriptional regulator [Prauserella marina]|uniref:DNA-binding transcriptional regulator, MarR family n=1 Tax=Prauserella marina TaxID=530584 RepID=A0A222VTT4_9PSEU|nr:MarR family transcriptional regulator [Prauserella marina]ASR37324.1 MarR family transcriptional regulator [Prauserella marina]PWV74820.1 DNA-binding MarR family transcriptional regulator [Prauserella marina]SDD39833.1 DNA-binding transcriptional regulator, MarR family [Prauserella marina]